MALISSQESVRRTWKFGSGADLDILEVGEDGEDAFDGAVGHVGPRQRGEGM